MKMLRQSKQSKWLPSYGGSPLRSGLPVKKIYI